MRFRGEGRRAATLLLAFGVASGLAFGMLAVAGQGGAGAGQARIMRPVDGAALGAGPVSILAIAPDGRLELDGGVLESERPFPDVLRASPRPGPGPHTLALAWPGGRREIRFFVGAGAPPPFRPFRFHPPFAVACTTCHAVREGRFVFQGGCFDCHARERFPLAHTHTADEMAACGTCHNAHGSTERAFLDAPRDKACSRCHALR